MKTINDREEQEIEEALWLIKTELKSANKKHPILFNSPHEGYAVLKEEVDEMWDDIKKNLVSHSILECAQVGAMAIKYIISVNRIVERQSEIT